MNAYFFLFDRVQYTRRKTVNNLHKCTIRILDVDNQQYWSNRSANDIFVIIFLLLLLILLVLQIAEAT